MAIPLPANDIVARAISVALDGTAQRQQVIVNNIANASTPGFKAQSVTFEASLSQALRSGRPELTSAQVTDSGTPVKQDGNSVDMTKEITDLAENGLMFEALVNAMSFKISSVRAALGR